MKNKSCPEERKVVIRSEGPVVNRTRNLSIHIIKVTCEVIPHLIKIWRPHDFVFLQIYIKIG